MRMKLHSVPHNIGHLVVTTIFESSHGMKNTSLYRFQTIVNVGYGTFKNYVGSIIQKPVLIHAGKMMLNFAAFYFWYFVREGGSQDLETKRTKGDHPCANLNGSAT